MDPRIARTRRSLQDALLALAREQPLEAISVADIVERAGVNRSSYYLHYGDKDKLLGDALDRTLDEHAPLILDAKPQDGHPPGSPMPRELTDYLEHMREHATLYRHVLGANGSSTVADRLQRRIDAIVTAAINNATVATTGVPVDVLAAGISGSIMGVVGAWIARDPVPPAETAALWIWRVLECPGADFMGEITE